MGVDVNGYIRPNITVEDIIDILKSMGHKSARFEAATGIRNGFGSINGLDIYLTYHGPPYNDCMPGHSILKARSTAESIKLMEDILNRVGGFIERRDDEGGLEEIMGMSSTSDGIPYFYQWGIINGHITDNHDISQLYDAIEAWHDRYSRNSSIAPGLIRPKEATDEKD